MSFQHFLSSGNFDSTPAGASPRYPGNDIIIGHDRTTGQPITLSRFDRARHTCIFGSTRSGKSKMVEHMCREDIRQWPKDHCPMIVLDPHGTLYKNLMAYITAEGFAECCGDWRESTRQLFAVLLSMQFSTAGDNPIPTKRQGSPPGCTRF